jgi:hypothetical protein
MTRPYAKALHGYAHFPGHSGKGNVPLFDFRIMTVALPLGVSLPNVREARPVLTMGYGVRIYFMRQNAPFGILCHHRFGHFT